MIAAGCLLVAAGFFAGTMTMQARQAASGSAIDILQRLTGRVSTSDVGDLESVWNAIHQKYVNSNVNDATLVQGAIAGLVNGLNDPYSEYFTPAESKDFEREITGTFEGVGMEVGYKNDQPAVIAPLPGSPAERAGLRAGDFILTIDGQDATKMKVDEVVSKIRGRAGTFVTLTVQRDGQAAPLSLKITRQTIKVDSVTTKTFANPKGAVGYVRISSFNADTGRAFQQAVRNLLGQSMRGLIIDLRNNPGGYLDQSVKVASVVIDHGPIVSEIGRDGSKKTLTAEGGALLDKLPVVVLVNKGSASASEIVAGALQDSGRATVIGEQTFGKGSVQDYETLDDGSSLKLTVAKWYTPKGRSISEQGITPDIAVTLSDDDYSHNRDPQLDKAKAIVEGKL